VDFIQRMNLLLDRKLDISGLTIRRADISGVVEIKAAAEGPKLLLISGIHGNEHCGVEAVLSLLEQFCSGALTLKKGTLKLVIANEEALKVNKRYIEHNLNRLFLDDLSEPPPSSYEWKRAQEIKPLIIEADYFIDLHSTSGPSEAFLFCEKPLLDYCRDLGVENIVVGWGSLGCTSIAGDTENYGFKHSSIGFTVECGQHNAPESFANALRISLNFLSSHKVIERPISLVELSYYFLRYLYLKNEHDFEFRKTFFNLESLSSGEIIGFSNKTAVLAPYDCAIVLPTAVNLASIGESLFMIAEKQHLT